MTLLHKPYHVPHIRAHEKTATRRDWKPNYAGPRIGSVQMVATADMVPDHYEHNSPMLLKEEDCTCFVQVMDKYPEPLGEMTDMDARMEGDYETVEDFKEGWERIHGESSWDPDHVVTVVVYEYVGREKPDITARMLNCPNCEFFEPYSDAVKVVEDILLGDEALEDWACDYHRGKFNQETREYVKNR